MRLRRLIIVTAFAAVCLAVLASLTATLPAQQIDPIQAAFKVMGADDIRSIRFSGFGASYSVSQSPNARASRPRSILKEYETEIDYNALSMRVRLTREQRSPSPRGGGQLLTEELRLVQFVSGSEAWDVVMSPHGFLRAAIATGATTRRSPLGTEVSFVVGGRRYLGIIDDRSLVDRVQTWIHAPGLGDTLVEAMYRDYETVDGIMFPMHITQRRGGDVSLDLWISSVRPNISFDIGK